MILTVGFNTRLSSCLLRSRVSVNIFSFLGVLQRDIPEGPENPDISGFPQQRMRDSTEACRVYVAGLIAVVGGGDWGQGGVPCPSPERAILTVGTLECVRAEIQSPVAAIWIKFSSIRRH